jgi:hypothetical protein
VTVFSEAFAAERARRTTRPERTRTPVLLVVGRALAVLGATAGKRLPRWPTMRRAALTIGGFGLLVAAAWMVAIPLGLLAAGASLLILEALTA